MCCVRSQLPLDRRVAAVGNSWSVIRCHQSTDFRIDPPTRSKQIEVGRRCRDGTGRNRIVRACNKGPFDEQMRFNPAEASGDRCGMTEPDRVESGRWLVANKVTALQELSGGDFTLDVSG
jgi:hypothetical protein